MIESNKVARWGFKILIALIGVGDVEPVEAVSSSDSAPGAAMQTSAVARSLCLMLIEVMDSRRRIV